MERLPLPESLSCLSVVLKVGAKYATRICKPVCKLWATISTKRRNFRVRRSFTARRSRFSGGALNPFRIEHADEVIRKIVGGDPEEHEVMFEVRELLVDPMFERLALEGKRGERATLPDYCGRARWIADAGIPGHADGWLSTIEEAAGQKEVVEREYLGRGEWKKLAKRMNMLPRKAGFASIPPISRRWRRPEKHSAP